MKIFVSPETFNRKGLSKFEAPMEQAGMCQVDNSLKLGQILIMENGKSYLVDINKDRIKQKKEG